jgi:uncharacterized protein (DUF927 family)
MFIITWLDENYNPYPATEDEISRTQKFYTHQEADEFASELSKICSNSKYRIEQIK